MDVLHTVSLAEVLAEHRRNYPSQVAAVDGPVRLTYAELDERVSRLADALDRRGFAGGDRALWLGQNSFRLLESLLAVARLGGALCPANWRSSADEMAFLLGDLDPKLVIWQDAEVGTTAREARDKAAGRALWLQHDGDGEGSYEELLTQGTPRDLGRVVDPSSPVLLMYTAAFGGRPSAAQLSHSALLLEGLVVSKLQDVDRGYVYLNCGPLFHVATFMTTMATFLWAGTNVFTPRVDAAELCRLIATERCTGAFIIGPTMQQVAEVNKDQTYDLSCLRTFKALPAFNEMTTRDLSPWGRRPGGYGQTEVMGLLTFSALGLDAKGSSGRPMPLAQVRIVDPDGAELPAGEVGEIVARGPTVMLGYHARDELNAAKRAGDWHHTGDLGRREADGSISFIGPMARLIKSAAENIYPAEVEQCLARHPAVRQAAVIGVPDAQWGQSVKAIVVLEAGHSVSGDELIEHVKGALASYKKPRTVELVEALPTKAGAVDYDALDARFGGGGYPTASSRS